MKFLRISSVLLALFFAVGCGTKTVDATGGVTKDTVTQEQQPTNETEPVTEIADNTPTGTEEQRPEGGFMDPSPADGSTYAGTDGSYGDDASTGDDSVNDPNTIVGDSSQNQEAEATLADGANGSGGIVVDSLTTIYFDFDKYDIRQDMKDYIRANAEYIKAQNISSIVLQGNTDEFGGDEYNMALGQKRALSVRDALVLQGLPKSMFSTISYGTHKPVCQEKTAECYAKNRRTDLVENK